MTQPNPAPGDPTPTPTPTPPADPAKPSQPPGDPATKDPAKPEKPLGPGGEKALQAEREARKALERQLAELAPLKQLAATLGGQSTGDGKTDLERLTERLDGYEQQIASERAARWRAEVAAEKQLTPQQAARLQGGTREELLADADALLSLFPAPAPAGPRTPAPDPSQGARGPVDLDALIRDAESKGDVKSAIRLKMQRQRTK